MLRTKAGVQLFDGNWDKDKRHGYGVSKYDGGSRHEGLYFGGQRHGLGVFLWPNGDKYSGHFTHGTVALSLRSAD